MDARGITDEEVFGQLQEYREQMREKVHDEAIENMAQSMLFNPWTTHIIYEGDGGLPPKAWGTVCDVGSKSLLVEMHSPFWDKPRRVQVAESEVTTLQLYG